MEATVEPGDGFAGVDVGYRRQRIRAQTLEEQSVSMRVRAQQPDGAVAVPAAQHQVLVFGVADLEDRGSAVGCPYGQHGRVDGVTVGAQIPFGDKGVETQQGVSISNGISLVCPGTARSDATAVPMIL